MRVNISVDAENYGSNFETVGSVDEIAKVIKARLDENVTEIRIKKQHEGSEKSGDNNQGRPQRNSRPRTGDTRPTGKVHAVACRARGNRQNRFFRIHSHCSTRNS